MDDTTFWREFSEFRIKEALGLWASAIIHLPYGKLSLFHPDDEVCLLQNGDLRKAAPSNVVDEVERHAGAFGLNAGFLFSSAWQGDVNGFRRIVTDAGYTKYSDKNWLLKTDMTDVDDLPESRFRVEETTDSDAVRDVFCTTFSFSEAIGRLVKLKMDFGLGPVETRFMLARDDQGRPVACAGYSYEGRLGYLHSLGTLEAYRNRGLGKHLVKARLQRLRETGVTHAVVAVDKYNTASLAVQRALGYRVFEETESWAKESHNPHAALAT